MENPTQPVCFTSSGARSIFAVQNCSTQHHDFSTFFKYIFPILSRSVLLALENFQKNSERYGMVISDIRMPVINGTQFIKEVEKIRPAFDIDYIQLRTELPFANIDEIIHKPISIENFIKTVSRHMNS